MSCESAQHLDALFKMIGFDSKDPEVASTVAGRLARLDGRIIRADREELRVLAGGVDLGTMVHQIVDALEPDIQLAAAVAASGSAEPGEPAVAEAAVATIGEAPAPLSSNPDLRIAILGVHRSYEQTIDEVTKDDLLFAGYSEAGRQRAAATVASFRGCIDEYAYEMLDQDHELVPFRDQVEVRYIAWLTAQEQQGVTFTSNQLQWLTWMKENIASEMGISPDSSEYTSAS